MGRSGCILKIVHHYLFLFCNNYRQFSFALVREAKRISFELIHEQLPLPVPCYDLLPVTDLTVGPTNVEISGTTGSLELTGGEYKT